MMKLMIYMIMLIFLLNYLKLVNYLFLSIKLFMLIVLMLLMLNFNNYWMLIYSNMAFDNFSLMMLMMSIWIMSICLSLKMNFKHKIYYFMLLILLITLSLSFLMINLFMFYFFYEVSLIPIFLIIMGWGYQPERLKASLYLFLYTLFFSLPFLFILFFLFLSFNTLNFFMMNFLQLNNNLEFYLYMLMFFVFLVKLPLMFLHNWLPKAHVEAPVVGSMILAAIMLKLGGYGIIRMLNFLMIKELGYMNDLMMIISVFGMILLSILCLRQFDMKVIVAYSSVVHMSMMLMGLLSMKNWGMIGGCFMMLGHGICSSSMFFMLNIIYIRSKSRNLMINKGMIYFIPSFMLFWFLLCMNNMSSPFSLNLLSEIMIVNVILNWSMKIVLLLFFGMFLSACYNIYLFSFSFHGMYSVKLLKIYSVEFLDFILLFLHLISLNLIFLKINLWI
uniref:NADH-ubiquinone oxidoreductase chain 4 n=1 Tax=Platencyrtus parkeri TaxID=752748 RepID=A0A7G5WI27_9HYME|nr:NADH dehydrogenase subunit 4 [Platencyrtus parkeri]